MKMLPILMAFSSIIVGACGSTIASNANGPSSNTTTIARSREMSTSISTSLTLKAALPACRSAQLTITSGTPGAALGHSGETLYFENRSTTSCDLEGYPGVAGLDAFGNEVTQARRSPSGYIGGLVPGHVTPPVVLMSPGQTASAIVEGGDNPTGTSTSCPVLYGLVVTAPNTHRSVKLKYAPGDCSGIEIHPVVPGITGSERT